MRRFVMYLFRWQLSSPILFCITYYLLLNEILEVIIANLIGGVIFFFVDRKIFQTNQIKKDPSRIWKTRFK